MNYMLEVAKMLGVELGEKFKINFENDPTNISGRNISDHEYFFSSDGIEVVTAGYACISVDVLFNLLRGKWTIKRKPWKPKDAEDDFWYVDADREVCRFSHFCSKDADYMNYYKLGNCYRTKEEAEANLDKWKAFYESDEVLEL